MQYNQILILGNKNLKIFNYDIKIIFRIKKLQVIKKQQKSKMNDNYKQTRKQHLRIKGNQYEAEQRQNQQNIYLEIIGCNQNLFIINLIQQFKIKNLIKYALITILVVATQLLFIRKLYVLNMVVYQYNFLENFLKIFIVVNLQIIGLVLHRASKIKNLKNKYSILQQKRQTKQISSFFFIKFKILLMKIKKNNSLFIQNYKNFFLW
ncbi:transmembrane protein, putative (macronuclear) [Tetrahymena thermophila SB210]|uniref:Transmembrane protein, putative n=1 Tax=Tetrahymena thermophila (strain SB210) TaxID=312017 RepID=W7XL61_TETTS|nr:transmembrane protein, putative [Tetrahymena thermophila SB210]EWS75729.1 transmembrane protein, putative [Tetrahymena thermophila SB210]|eukprot:XP_012651651.1 transmembrane protein, putative [Tetrahymena thermophila SB210]